MAIGTSHSRRARRRQRGFLLACGLVVALASMHCSRRSKDPCKALHADLPKGVVLSAEPGECAEILAFGKSAVVSEWPSFEAWLDAVPAQRVNIMMDLIFALVEKDAWEPVSFEREPTKVPCGEGVAVTDAWWAGSTLARAGVERPERLYASYSLDVLGPDDARGGVRVRIRAYQDFDCDGEVATSEMEGVYRRGGYVLGGGWTPLRTSFAQVHE